MLDFRLLTFLDLCHTKNYTKTAKKPEHYATCCLTAYPVIWNNITTGN